MAFDIFGNGGTSPAGTSVGGSSFGTAGQIGGGVGLIGLGLEAFGASETASAESDYYKQSQQIASDEIQQDKLRMQQAQLTANRQGIENLRNVQRARAVGLSTAVEGSAQFSSGLAGAQAGETAKGAFNQQGINQNLAITQGIFDINTQINQARIAQAQDQSKANQGQGLFGLGQGATQAAGTIGQLLAFA